MIDLQSFNNWVSEKLICSIIEPFNLTHNNSSIKMFIKREDLIHDTISGNKLRKLKYNIIAAEQNGCKRLLTFGGAFSNHILATASLCLEFQIPLTIMVRGDELTSASNKILSYCQKGGIDLRFLSRDTYTQLKKMNGLNYMEEEKYWCIPEGGANEQGILGASEILKDVEKYDAYIVAQGTTTTSLGIYRTMADDAKLYVVPSLRNFNCIAEMKSMSGTHEFSKKIVPLVYDELGRYGKMTETLQEFQNSIQYQTTILFDPIYTLKALFAYCKFIVSHKNQSLKSDNVLFIHTGGLNQDWWN